MFVYEPVLCYPSFSGGQWDSKSQSEEIRCADPLWLAGPSHSLSSVPRWRGFTHFTTFRPIPWEASQRLCWFLLPKHMLLCHSLQFACSPFTSHHSPTACSSLSCQKLSWHMSLTVKRKNWPRIIEFSKLLSVPEYHLGGKIGSGSFTEITEDWERL